MNRTLLALISVGLAAAGCSSNGSSDSPTRRNDLGTGLNTVSRKYAKPAPEVWDAAVSATKSYDFTIDSDRHDKMGGDLVAHRAGGEKVDVQVRSVDAQNTQVSVRVEPGNKNMAMQIHEKIGEKVGMGTSKAGLPGEYSVDGTYRSDLKRCTSAAETACKNVKLAVIGKEMLETSAVVDAQASSSAPVRIQMDKATDTTTKVTFIAGEADGSDPKQLTSRLKAEFDRQIAAVER